MFWEGGYYRVCLEQNNSVKLVDSGEIIKNPDLSQIRTVNEYICKTNALPVITVDESITGKSLSIRPVI